MAAHIGVVIIVGKFRWNLGWVGWPVAKWFATGFCLLENSDQRNLLALSLSGPGNFETLHALSHP